MLSFVDWSFPIKTWGLHTTPLTWENCLAIKKLEQKLWLYKQVCAKLPLSPLVKGCGLSFEQPKSPSLVYALSQVLLKLAWWGFWRRFQNVFNFCCCYFVIKSILKRVWSFILTHTQGCHVPSMVAIGSVETHLM